MIATMGLVFVLPAVLAAQDPRPPRRADYSGVWTVNFQKSRLQIDAPDRTVFTVTHREPHFTLSRTHTFAGQTDTWEIALTTDGAEVRQARGNRMLSCRLTWDVDALVLMVRIAAPDGEATNEVRYELSADGPTMTGYERFRSAARNYDNVWVLERTGRSAAGARRPVEPRRFWWCTRDKIDRRSTTRWTSS